jgi:mannosyltransferase OCH1-like enzyme
MTDCLASWVRFLPGYTIKRWDEANSPMGLTYLTTASRMRLWANMSNLVRLHALITEGGIYLDTDVEVLRPFDELLTLPSFVGCENKSPRVNNAIFGAEKGHPFVTRMRQALLTNFTGTESADKSSPVLTTRLLQEMGLDRYSERPRMVGRVMVFPTDYFYPYYVNEQFSPACITPNTYTAHHWAKSWQLSAH